MMLHSTTAVIKRALLSVTDKSELISLAHILTKYSVELIASGGTLRHLLEANFIVTPLEEVTHFPECFQGRVKTLSPYIAGGLLMRQDSETDQEEAQKLGIRPIDLVVCNLYNYENSDSEIDIGGVTLLRAAAKNHQWVTVLSHPTQYQLFIDEFLSLKGTISQETRFDLAGKAFKLTSYYDLCIASEFMSMKNMKEEKTLRYGENPHQKAYLLPNPFQNPHLKSNATNFEFSQLQGKALSYNNYLDIETAWMCATDLRELSPSGSSVVIVKHAGPCGLATAKNGNIEEALIHAFESDPVSAFGSIVAFTTTVTDECALFLKDKFIEVIIAPDFDTNALSILAHKQQLRLIKTSHASLSIKQPHHFYRSLITGEFLKQEHDAFGTDELMSVTKNPFPVDRKGELAQFGMIAVKYLKSNAVALVAERKKGTILQLMGSGMGQPNRVDSLKRLAIPRAKELAHLTGTYLSQMVLVGDAFFPFSDAISEAFLAGITYIVAPAGSIRDAEVIAKADELGVMMAHTNHRHFRH